MNSPGVNVAKVPVGKRIFKAIAHMISSVPSVRRKVLILWSAIFATSVMEFTSAPEKAW